MNKQTANQYYTRLISFEKFIVSHYSNKNNNVNLDNFIQEVKENKFDVYKILSDYSIYLSEKINLHTTTLKQRVVTVKNFLEFHDIDISPRKFKIKVKLPKNIKRNNKEAIDKNDIVSILNGCSDFKLKTYVMLLAVTGARATEALSIREKDIDFESDPSKIKIRGEFTKTKTDRYVFITKELKEQLIKWLDFKYRKRRICYRDQNGKTITEYRTPEQNPNELIFSLYQTDTPRPETLYNNIAIVFAKTLDRIGLSSREDGRNENRREITLHSFRSYVKSTISDLGYSDYSEWFIGHSGSTYWRKKDSEKAELFKK
ncbi:MAG TPA: site-specific integrase [Nitrososphaeraceae archaeon]